MARGGRPAQGQNSTKRIQIIRAAGPLLRRTVLSTRNRHKSTFTRPR